MTNPEPVFKGILDDIEKTDLEEPIASAKDATCSYYTTPFSTAATKANEAGESGVAAVYKFLGILCSFQLGNGDPTKPFTPMWIMDGQRSLVPDDLSDGDLDAIEALTKRIADPALRARLFDVLWERRRRHPDCLEAASSYVAAALRLDVEKGWVHAVKLYHRALRLGAKLGRTKSAFETASKALLDAINRDSGSEEGFRTCQLLQVAADFHCGESAELAEISNRIAEKALASKEYRRARN